MMKPLQTDLSRGPVRCNTEHSLLSLLESYMKPGSMLWKCSLFLFNRNHLKQNQRCFLEISIQSYISQLVFYSFYIWNHGFIIHPAGFFASKRTPQASALDPRSCSAGSSWPRSWGRKTWPQRLGVHQTEPFKMRDTMPRCSMVLEYLPTFTPQMTKMTQFCR